MRFLPTSFFCLCATLAGDLVKAASIQRLVERETSQNETVQLGRRQSQSSPKSVGTGFAYYTPLDNSYFLQYTSDSQGVFNSVANKNAPVLTLDLTTAAQPFDGLGSSLTDASVTNFQAAKAANGNSYRAMLQNTFDRYTGLNILRIPIGATDFSTRVYTYADNQPRPTLSSTPSAPLLKVSVFPTSSDQRYQSYRISAACALISRSLSSRGQRRHG